MIISRIASGMGNQMFMYAAGLSLSKRLDTELKLHFQYSCNNGPYFPSCFPEIKEQNISFSELLKICPRQAFTGWISGRLVKKYHLFRRLLRKILSQKIVWDNLPKKGFYEAKYASYLPEFENIQDNNYIYGYFESEKCFANIENLARKRFRFAPECFNGYWLQKIKSCNSAALHVRRGDKINNIIHRGSNEDYIKRALEKIFSLTDEPRFFVFSDDIEWCKKTLPLIRDAEYNFIEGNTPQKDMALMTQCKHVIMGPSTFSWWGAWLTETPKKIIIAPDINLWYQENKYNRKDRKNLLPDRWIKIS